MVSPIIVLRAQPIQAIGGHSTKYACIVEADESMRIRTEGAPHRYHEDHIAGKGMNSSSHYNQVHKFILFLKIPDAKVAADESQKQKGGDR